MDLLVCGMNLPEITPVDVHVLQVESAERVVFPHLLDSVLQHGRVDTHAPDN